ncbi:MAG: hypothetical protein PHP45_11015 [Elusimicrobiales bacterium]|nr:hypothetical protein [Elusimicrobiales bacterium]
MKKTLLLLLLACPSFASGLQYGAEFSANSRKPKTADFDRDTDFMQNGASQFYYPNYYRADVTPNNFNPETRVFAEGKSPLKLGVSAGVSYISPVTFNSLGVTAGNASWTRAYSLSAFMFPAELYLKYRPRGERVSLSLGGGADYVMAKTSVNITGPAGTASGDFTSSGLMTHLSAGMEVFIFRHVSIGADFKYLFNGVLENFKGAMSDPRNVHEGSGDSTLMMLPEAGGHEMLVPRLDTDPALAGARPMRADFGGFYGRVALRIYFGGGLPAPTRWRAAE